jgi:hypothetical protein
MVTAYVPAWLELQESVAVPDPFGIAEGSMAVHVMSAGRGKSERVTVPVKLLKGFTMMVVVAEVVPSAGTTFGRVAPTVKSETEFELNVECEAESDSAFCTANTGLAVMLSKTTVNRILLIGSERLAIFSDSRNKLGQKDGGRISS